MPYARLTSHQPAKAEQRYWNEPNSPLYPFGFGLSHSTFRYSTPYLDARRIAIGEAVTVSFVPTNAGSRTADETAQVYIHQRFGTSARPVRELKAFKRVTLVPGETRSMEFTLGPNEIRHWSEAEGGWTQDETIIDVYVGSDSTALFGGSFEVARPGPMSYFP